MPAWRDCKKLSEAPSPLLYTGSAYSIRGCVTQLARRVAGHVATVAHGDTQARLYCTAIPRTLAGLYGLPGPVGPARACRAY